MSDDNKEQEMQTVVSSYTPHQEDNTLIDVHNFTNDTNFYQCADDRLSPNEKINVEDDKEDLIIDESRDASDVNIDSFESRDEEIKATEEKRETEVSEPSWHPHVYGKPPKKPTPHTIDHILGLSNVDKSSETKKSTVSQLMNVKINFDVKKPFGYQEKSVQVSDVDRNLLSVHKNKLQEQLLQKSVRTSDSEFDKVLYYKCEEQPLNLSVPKSKDSPSWADDDRVVKGECFSIYSPNFVVLRYKIGCIFLNLVSFKLWWPSG